MNYFIAVPLGFFAAFLLLRTAGILYLRRYLAWETANRRGLSYYGRPLAARQAFKKELKRRSRFLIPFLWFETKLQRKPSQIPSIEYEGVAGPSYSSTRESFEAASRYKPAPEDIFIATQMKCGTTWMQQVVYEVLYKGEGDLSDKGHGHLYAASPWLEAVDGVSIKDAPLLGPKGRGRRLIKTHLPARLCPSSESAQYIYVTRHPVSCFASVVDYFQLMTGFLAQPLTELVEWFTSDRMWWLSWPEHVAGWWDWAAARKNILFIPFEEMKQDLEGVIRKVAQFIGEPLTEEEVKKVAYKSGFQYMKENEEFFEMSPPNLFSVSGTYFKSGSLDRHQGVSEAARRRILDFCCEKLKGKAYPVDKFYQDINQDRS